MSSENQLKIMNPASGAIIMALGVFLYAGIEAFPFIDHVGHLLTVGLVAIGVYIYQSLILQVFRRDFLIPFLNNPVNSFTIGTWIAGISVLCNVIMKYFPGMSEGVQWMAVANTILYLFFIAGCIYNFKQLWKRPTDHSPHGVVLLSTVATQSLVIVWVEVFPSLPSVIVHSAMLLGVLFYLCGVLLIGIRYAKEKQWSLAEDWANTNCIIHGALSITGLAIVSSQSMSDFFMLIYWLVVLGLLISVEMIEVTRAVKRVRKYGWKEAIFTYNISQWSRNFTFGMFYAFSIKMHENPFYKNAIYDFQEGFLNLWAWVVLIVLVGEIGLWMVGTVPRSAKALAG